MTSTQKMLSTLVVAQRKISSLQERVHPKTLRDLESAELLVQQKEQAALLRSLRREQLRWQKVIQPGLVAEDSEVWSDRESLQAELRQAARKSQEISAAVMEPAASVATESEPREAEPQERAATEVKSASSEMDETAPEGGTEEPAQAEQVAIEIEALPKLAKETQQPEEALTLSDMLDKNPKDPQLWRRRSQEWKEKRDRVAAISDLLRATELVEDDPSLWNELGQLYKEAGLRSRAMACYAQMKKLSE